MDGGKEKGEEEGVIEGILKKCKTGMVIWWM